MLKKKILIPLFLFVAVFLIANQVSAYRGDMSVKGPNYSQERHDAMLKAFENKDYSAWKELNKDKRGKINEVINQDNFPKFVEMHQLMLDGKLDEAQKIRQELGLGNRDGMNRDFQGFKNGKKGCNYPNNRSQGINK